MGNNHTNRGILSTIIVNLLIDSGANSKLKDNNGDAYLKILTKESNLRSDHENKNAKYDVYKKDIDEREDPHIQVRIKLDKNFLKKELTS